MRLPRAKRLIIDNIILADATFSLTITAAQAFMSSSTIDWLKMRIILALMGFTCLALLLTCRRFDKMSALSYKFAAGL